MNLIQRTLKVNNPELTLTIEGDRLPNWFERLIGKRGFIRYKRTQKANSLTRGFIDIWFTLLVSFSAGALTTITAYPNGDCIDSGGNSRVSGGSYTFYNGFMALYGNTTCGIVVGSGTNAVAVGNTGLQTQISHGTGAGNLLYSGQGAANPVTNGSSRLCSFTRSFFNGTASTVTINEVGMQIYGNAASAWLAYSFMFERTLSTISVPAGGGVTITYTMKVTV